MSTHEHLQLRGDRRTRLRRRLTYPHHGEEIFYVLEGELERIAGLYAVDPAQVELFWLPDIRVITMSFPRRVVQGSFADRDMHSGLQHISLATLLVS
jgi:hypothetical protein